MTQPQEKDDKGFPVSGEVMTLAKRGLSAETCAKWRYTTGTYSGKPVQIANYCAADGSVIAQKVRFPNKDFLFLGNAKNAGLYGQHLWRDGGRMVVVTEGEIDALSVSQLQNNKWPVVSLPTGAGGAVKALKDQLQWLEKFESVILMFDNDEPGNAAAAECAPLFTPGKCKVARLPLKDANAMMQDGRGAEVISAMWDAKAFRPDGIVSANDLLDTVGETLPDGTPWCFDELTEITHGRRDGELYAFGAGTGVGKTDLFTQQIDYDARVLGIKCGVIYLEQPPSETLRRISGKAVGRIFHVPGNHTGAEVRAAAELVSPNIELFDHFGAMDWPTIKSNIRYMVVALGCRHIYLDHLTALVAGEEDEKKALDAIMAEAAAQAQGLGHKLHFISHLATPEGKPHEEGGRVTIRHFRGSRSIGFWSHFMFGLERDQQADNEAMRSISIFRVLKDRVTGASTGKTIALRYVRETGRLEVTTMPADGEARGFKNETKPNEDF